MSVQKRVEAISQNTNLSLETPHTTVKIELTGICTLGCKFCYNRQMKLCKERQSFLKEEDFIHILRELKTVPTLKEVGLFYMGESGLHYKLADFYKQLKEEGYFTYLTTNGTVNAVAKAIPYIDSLKISWNYKNLNDFQEKTGGSTIDYIHIKDNIKFFKEICHLYNKKLTVSTVLDGSRKNYEDELAQLNYDDHYWIPLQTQGGSYADGLSGVVGEDDHKVSPIPCWSLFKGIYIDVDLNVRTCCYGHTKEHIVGNLRDSSLRNILDSDQLMQMKIMHLNNKIPEQCKKCLMKE